MATFSCSWKATTTNATLTAVFSGGDSGFVGTRYVYFEVDGGEWLEIIPQSASGGSTTITYTIGGLSPNTTYDWYAYLGYKASGESSITWLEEYYSDSGTFTTESAVNVDYWSWTSTNTPYEYATSTQTRNAYSAVRNKGSLSNFSYLVWNDMCAKIREIRLAYIESTEEEIDAWDSYYLSYTNTKMTDTDKILTADRFNSLRYNIDSIYPGGSGVQKVSKGDTVYGSYFTTIMSRANDWIDTL